MRKVTEVSRKSSEGKAKCADAFLETLVGTWTCQRPGGTGELESVDHGWSRDPEVLAGDEGKFSVCRPMIGFLPSLLEQVQEARGYLAHLPLFFFLRRQTRVFAYKQFQTIAARDAGPEADGRETERGFRSL